MKIMKIDLLDRVHISPGAMRQLIAELAAELSAKGLVFVENAAESPASPSDVL